ncbi:NCS2 family permease [Ligilactobacillus apodemi]|uniref:Purine transport protein n=1 Tax=Ligilactobacillus apodemi DSM 16634 = JCM 16172 TaxID=1423724 RepID=A0A0R1U3W3_9LACO|nr:NCS2 family permease [Ligilactobacillus apodemi]KRL87332.1 purine transport protein [Ligilactobacillus apodemi DSM 16634 = JCM 16172]
MLANFKSLTKEQRKTEIIAGLTGFFAISYIIIVNPIILTDAKIPAALSVFATIFSSALGCLIMGLWANAPIIITPGMGVNAFFTYTLVIGMKLDWQQAIAISIISSVIYMIVAFSKVSEKLSQAIPQELKIGITAGIGMFLVTLGLEKAQLITQGDSRSLLAVGDLAKPEALLALFGLALTLVLYLRKTTGGFMIAIIVTSALGAVLNIGLQDPPKVSLADLWQYKEILAQGDFSSLFSLKFLLAVFSMTMILVFESMGILEGLLPEADKFKKTFEASSVATFCSGFLGTSPTVAAAESAAGIESGGKTGLMSLVSGGMFLLALFFIPLLSYVPQAAIAPVIIITGAIMMQQLKAINFDDFSEWFPAFLIVVLIPLTGSISVGLAFGFAAYPLVKIAAKKSQAVTPLLAILSILFILQLICEAVFL